MAATAGGGARIEACLLIDCLIIRRTSGLLILIVAIL
jgi:hypothetical protein